MNKIIKNTLFSASLIFFIGCGDNTTDPQIKDITSVDINESNLSIYSTDFSKTLSAVATYSDSSSEYINNPDIWSNSDYDALSMYNGVITPASNGGSSIVSINVGDFSDELNVTIIKLMDFNITNSDINTSGEYYTLEATGYFEDNTSKLIQRNIAWSATNDATIIFEDNVTKISLVAGETNVTASVFGETNASAQTLAPKSVIYTVD
jgi:hypothetical protein